MKSNKQQSDPVYDAFRSWLNLDTDQRQRLNDMITGFNASCELYGAVEGEKAAEVVAATEPRKRRKRTTTRTPMDTTTPPASKAAGLSARPEGESIGVG